VSSNGFIPLAVPNVGKGELQNLAACIEGNWVSSVGPFVEELERLVGEVSGTSSGVAVAAGTMGLHASLVAIGVGPGDLVVLPSFTFIASANAISHCGAQPWLVDIDPATWSLDARTLAAALDSETGRDDMGVLRHLATGKRVAAILPVYVLGTPAEMDAIRAVAAQYKLPIVADAAAAVGARYKGGPIGPLADLTVYSFNGNKTITTGGGGMIVGPDKALVDIVRHLTTTARRGPDYHHDRIGFNYRMTNVEAAIGCAQMGRLPEFLAAKRRIRRRYNEAFAEMAQLTPLPEPGWAESAYWFSGFVMEPGAGMSAAELCAALNKVEIGARPFWKPIHLQPPYESAPRVATDVCDGLWHRIVTLPCSTSLTEADQDRVIAAVKAILGQRRPAAVAVKLSATG
jgi:perosamine synthetase